MKRREFLYSSLLLPIAGCAHKVNCMGVRFVSEPGLSPVSEQEFFDKTLSPRQWAFEQGNRLRITLPQGFENSQHVAIELQMDTPYKSVTFLSAREVRRLDKEHLKMALAINKQRDMSKIYPWLLKNTDEGFLFQEVATFSFGEQPVTQIDFRARAYSTKAKFFVIARPIDSVLPAVVAKTDTFSSVAPGEITIYTQDKSLGDSEPSYDCY